MQDSQKVSEEDGSVVSDPIQQKHYTLDSLVEGITPDNLHREISFGDGPPQDETEYLLRSPANAERLMRSIDSLRGKKS